MCSYLSTPLTLTNFYLLHLQKLDEWKEEIESCKLLFYSGNMRVWNEVHAFVTVVFALFENHPKRIILGLHIADDSQPLHLLPAFLILKNYCRYMHLMTQGYLWQETMSAGARCPTVFDNHDLESFKGGYQISVVLSSYRSNLLSSEEYSFQLSLNVCNHSEGETDSCGSKNGLEGPM